MTMPMKNVIISIVMLVVGVFFAFLSSELPERSIGGVPGPSFFPGVVSILVVILSIALLARGIRGIRAQQGGVGDISFPYKPVFIVFWFLLFIAVLPYAGFLVAGVPFFAGLMLMCEKRSPVHIVIGSLVIPVFLYFLFREGFSILLPAGQWM